MMMILIKSIALLLFLVFPCPTSALSFDFPNFSPNDPNITLSLSAKYGSSNSIWLTEYDRFIYENSLGRATYAQPLYLWNRSSGILTDFTTHFSFSISTLGSTVGDGLAFFLVPNGSSIPNDGLPSTFGLTSFADQPAGTFVAVEFDVQTTTAWDDAPDYLKPKQHVGIDINSVISNITKPWWCGNTIVAGEEHNAMISYDSESKTLTVLFTAYRQDTWYTDHLSYTVDLRDYLPEYVNFGFTAGTWNLTERHTINSWNFSSTLDLPSLNGAQRPPPNSSAATPSQSIGTIPDVSSIVTPKSKTGLIIGIVSSVCVMFLLVLGLVMYYCCFCKKRKTVERKLEEPSVLSVICNDVRLETAPMEITYDDLKEATNNFAEDNKLGEGGFGSVYKGCLKKTNSIVAVKRVSSDSTQGTREYATEVKIISTLRHKSLVRLLGWCHERKQELLLVYEFLPNGSLDFHLFNNKASLLDWGIRMKMAKELASALLYLHEMWEHCVLHRDIKSANIMLDEHFNIKLGDFGLARMVDHQKGSKTSVHVSGTWGYMAPEYMNTCNASKETDVYSYGVVALEIATGKRAIHNTEQGPVNLVEWVWSLHGIDKLLEAVDPRLGSDINRLEIARLMTVGLWCAHPDRNSRPSISQVARVLDCEAQLPDFPLRMPTAPGYPYSGSTKAFLTDTESSNRSESFPAVSSSYVSSTTG